MQLFQILKKNNLKMKIIKTKFKGLKIIKSKIFYDKRGYFREIAKKKILNNNFIFDCMSQ